MNIHFIFKILDSKCEETLFFFCLSNYLSVNMITSLFEIALRSAKKIKGHKNKDGLTQSRIRHFEKTKYIYKTNDFISFVKFFMTHCGIFCF